MQYRREIDGLRAVAVLPVILFHAGFSVFSGGYVGVDVFFVISGYLITSILIAELEQGNFSIARFYERRVRRILPALFVVMLACLPFAYMWMLPSQLKDFAQSLIAVVFFASNILFWREDGYFAAAAELKPLLHTWSLAVEEQYYLLLPILLLVLWRFGRQRTFWGVVALAVLSLVLSEWGWRNKPSANFYLAPTRAWELLAGSICAFITVGKVQRLRNFLSAIGLALIVFAIFAYDANNPFPSVYALVPVVGTGLIILFGTTGTWVARLLSLRTFVGIGLISYSAYLWHQPLFAFARLRSMTEPSNALMAALAAASLLLAWATWYWVEQAFRKRANPLFMKRRSVFALSGGISAVFVVVGLAGHLGEGFGWRLKYISNDSVSLSMIKEVETQWNRSGYSEPRNWVKDRTTGLHVFGSNTTERVVLLGDSHSQQYWNSFDVFYGDKDRSKRSKSLIVIHDQEFPPNAEIANLLQDKTIKTVVLSYFWAFRYRSASVNEYIRCCGNGPDGIVGSTRKPFTEVEMTGFDNELSAFVDDLIDRGIKVLFVLDNPFGEEFDAQSLISIEGTYVYQRGEFLGLPKYEALARAEPVRRRILKIAEELGVGIIDPIEYLCSASNCPVFDQNGRILYKDYDHISEYASKNRTNYIWSVLD